MFTTIISISILYNDIHFVSICKLIGVHVSKNKIIIKNLQFTNVFFFFFI